MIEENIFVVGNNYDGCLVTNNTLDAISPLLSNITDLTNSNTLNVGIRNISIIKNDCILLYGRMDINESENKLYYFEPFVISHPINLQ